MAEQASHLYEETRQPRKGDIYFERATHAVTQAEKAEEQAKYYRFLAGDKTAHGWNREVTQSMMAYQPLSLALDGLPPLLTGNLAHLYPQLRSYPLTDEYKQSLWFALPGAPSEINKQGVVTLVAGDVSYNNVFLFFRDISEPMQDMQTGQAIQNAYDTLQSDASGSNLFANH